MLVECIAALALLDHQVDLHWPSLGGRHHVVLERHRKALGGFANEATGKPAELFCLVVATSVYGPIGYADKHRDNVAHFAGLVRPPGKDSEFLWASGFNDTGPHIHSLNSRSLDPAAGAGGMDVYLDRHIPRREPSDVPQYENAVKQHDRLVLLVPTLSDFHVGKGIDHDPRSHFESRHHLLMLEGVVGGVRSGFGVFGRVLGELGGKDGGTHSDRADNQSDPSGNAGSAPPNRPFIGAVSGLPLSAQVGGTIVLTLLACGVQGFGVLRLWQGRWRSGLGSWLVGLGLLFSSALLWW